MTNKHKFFRGDLKAFKEWLGTLDKTSEKYKDINKTIVWIHPDLGKDNANISSSSGWIYAYGSYFNATSVGNIMSIVDGRVYINGKDASDNEKQYKILNSSDVENCSEGEDDLVTYGYLKTYRMFEALN